MAKVTFNTNLHHLDGSLDAEAANALMERGFIYVVNEAYGDSLNAGEFGRYYLHRAVFCNNLQEAQNLSDVVKNGERWNEDVVTMTRKFLTYEEKERERAAARQEKAAKEAAKAEKHAEWAKKKADTMGLTVEEFERLRVLRKKASSCRSSAKKAAEAVAEAEKWLAKEQGYLQELEAEIAELEGRG